MVAERITPETELVAAMRLVSVTEPEKESAARRLLAAGPRHGVDFSRAWAVMGPPGPSRRVVRQVCLGVPGSGRTGMVFLSEPPPGGDVGGPEAGLAERVACLRACCADMAKLVDASGRRMVAVVQALPEPREEWSTRACRAAGFIDVGLLTYMRAMVPPVRRAPPVSEQAWPGAVQVVSAAMIPAGRRDAVLMEALDASYQQTLDCPELCGMRETRDILESHRATGVHDPGMWWVVFDGQTPSGTMLLAKCPEQQAVELVYLGLAPGIRGKGIARRLMEMAVRATAMSKLGELTCAVDQRNLPAVRLYESCGLRAFSQRVALVRPV